MKFREVIRLIEDDGWFLATQQGSDRQLKHPVKGLQEDGLPLPEPTTSAEYLAVAI